MKSQAIIIPCYKRIFSLKRLLATLNQAEYLQPIDLIFSIDFSGENDVENLCENFHWTYGKKIIIKHQSNIGLKANIIFCGDLLFNGYDRIILLEDDILVSSAFCNYALSAADFYENDENIAGISLFSYAKSEIGMFSYYPLKDEFDTFFMQWPSSWGQLWTKKQWEEFKNWFRDDYDFSKRNIPNQVKKWTNSWKKYFVAYLVETNKYFVYPYFSFSGEGGFSGTHASTTTINSPFNNSMCGCFYNFKFRRFDANDKFKYDCFFQPIPRQIIIDNRKYVVSFDLYGTKDKNNYNTDFIITSKGCDNYIKKFAAIIFPLELNVENEIYGDLLFLLETKFYNDKDDLPIENKLALRMELNTKDIIFLLFRKIVRRLKL